MIWFCPAKERPCLCYGMRGVVDLELALKGGERDLHSGVNGGLLPEPWMPSGWPDPKWVAFCIFLPSFFFRPLVLG